MRQKISTKEEIFKVMSKLIEKNGLASISMRQIAESSNLALGTLYNYFPSQEALYDEFFDYSWRNTLDRLNGIDISSNNAKDLFQLYNNILKEEIMNRKGLGKIIYTSIHPKSNFLTDDHFVINKLPESLIPILKCSIKLNQFSDLVLKELAYLILIGMIKLIITANDDNDLIDAMITLYF